MSETPSLTRRAFLQTTAATAALATLPAASHAQPPDTPAPWPENGTLIPDDGWHLWLDQSAPWQQDTIYLPEQISRAPDGTVLGDGTPLPVHAPTGGWAVLEPSTSNTFPVTLPSTVEQHVWGRTDLGCVRRSYTPEEYRYAADDPIPQLGAYFGVSWWFRPIDVPADHRGKRLFLHIRGARLRAEVYLNGHLVGYSIMEELPFECDCTSAANPGGENLLAIRITNPFGRYDWVDGTNAQWGAVRLYRSHGFAGLDRGITLSAHEWPTRVRDVFVLNSLKPGQILVCLEFQQLQTSAQPIDFELRVIDPITGKSIGENGNFIPALKSGETITAALPITCDEAVLWTLNKPKLYHLHVHFAKTRKTPTGALAGDSETEPSAQAIQRTIPFGFRTFGPANIGSKTDPAFFRMNGRRIKLYSSISWGFWGLNGLFPTPELAEKEVSQAKKLNLNCLNFHRNLAKEEVLRAQDRLGLLRYLEPGGGKLAIGKLPEGVQANAAGIVMEKATSPADKFAQRFMFVKCVEMVKAFRGHTSVIQYTLQNEIGADLNNPDTLAILAAMRVEDPSRSIVLNDGFVAPPRKAAQAWYEPWNDKLHRTDQEPWGDWWNQHQGAGDQWYDEFYKSPTDFTYAAPDYPGCLTEFGEMEGCATPDNHALMLHQQASPGNTGLGQQPPNHSYDHVDHAEIDAAYNKFLDRCGFREAFPTTEHLYRSLGQKCYNTWQNYLENARISDALDYAVISGWESTSIENHSGIVDNQRNFKSDPEPIAGTLQPIRPIAKQRSICTALGQSATFDLFLINDTGQPAIGTLEFSATAPSGRLLKLGTFPAPVQKPDTFSYLLEQGFQTPPLTEEGFYLFRLAISSSPLATQAKAVWVTRLNNQNLICIVHQRIALSGVSPSLRLQLQKLYSTSCAEFLNFRPGERYTLIVTSGLTSKASTTQESGDTTGLESQPTAPKVVPGRKLEPGEAPTDTHLGHIDPAVLEAARAGTPLFVIPQTDALSDGCAKQLAAVGAFTFAGNVGDFRAPWMGNWYFVRKHPLYEGMPVDQAMGIHYQAKGRQSNGLLVGGPGVEIVVGYSRDHDRNIGAGTFTARLGKGKLLYHRVPELHPVLQERFLANALRWLAV